MTQVHPHIVQSHKILIDLGLPPMQHNERSALCLLALLNVTPAKQWTRAENPLIGIIPIMNWIRKHYQKEYAPNTRETFRRQTMHQFVENGIVFCNPDKLDRAINSPKTVYQIERSTLELLRSYGTHLWHDNLSHYLAGRETLLAKYAKERQQRKIPLLVAHNKKITISPGEHSELIKAVLEEFGPRFAPGSSLIYVGDTGDKWSYFDAALLAQLGITVHLHGKMPDLILHDAQRNWLMLVEAVTSHGPVDSKRHAELALMFAQAKCGIVYITAFPSRILMARYFDSIAWETEVWVADAPSHLIHFDGERFLGPYATTEKTL